MGRILMKNLQLYSRRINWRRRSVRFHAAGVAGRQHERITQPLKIILLMGDVRS